MANVISPNMSLILATPGQELGPQYAADQNQDLLILDMHNHGPGSGVQITPAGLDISTNLNFQNNSPYNISSVIFSNPMANVGLTTLYTNSQTGGGITDLFYNDGAGNVIALTKAGLVNATIASIPGESYAGGTFTWKQGAGSTIPANFDIGSITIRPNVASTTYGVVLNPPSSISSEYDIQLPIVPSVVSIMQLDTAGNMIATLVPDNSTLIISSQVLQINPTYTAGITAQSPPGSIIMYGGVLAPTSYLLCDGTSYLISSYPNLAAALFDSGTGNYAYGSADVSHFNVPDFRGIFPRGVDGGTGQDPNSSSRTAANPGGNTGDNVGSFQTNATAINGLGISDPGHLHIEQYANGGGSFNGIAEETGATNVGTPSINTTNSSVTGISLISSDSETRPINLYVNFIIKT